MQKVAGLGLEYGPKTPEAVAAGPTGPRHVEEPLLAQSVPPDVSEMAAVSDGVVVSMRLAKPRVSSPRDSDSEPVGRPVAVNFEPEERQV